MPAGCIVHDADSLPYFNVRDGYCLRYPSGFRVGEVFSGVANIYGHPRTPGPEPLMAGLVIMVEDLDEEETLAEVADDFVREQQRVGWLSPVCTRTLTVLGGQSAVLLEGPGEYTTKHIFLTVHDGRRYTLSLWPDAHQFPLVAEDVHALWQTVPVSFSFLPKDFLEPGPSAGEDPDTAPPLPPQGTLRTWEIPRLVFQRADRSLWASALDGGDPWPLTGPLTGTTDAIHWAPPADGRWLAYIQAGRPTVSLYVLDLESGEQKTVLGALLPHDLDRDALPPDADVAVRRENTVVWHSDGTRLAFVSAHEGSADLYVYDRVSGQVQRLAGGVDNVFWPFWSPDDQYLLYHTAPRFGRRGSTPAGSALWIVPVAGGTPRRLTIGDRVESALGWTDDRHLAVLEPGPSSFHDLALIDVTSGQRTLLLEGSVMQATWSASARLLAVVPHENERYTTGLWLVDPDDPEPILLGGEHDLPSPRWSPQGRYLIYNVGTRCWLYDPQDGATYGKPRTWFEGRWSPDERYIAHANDRLDLIDVETGESQAITAYPVHSARWSPDGEWLVWLWLRDASEQRFDMLALHLGADEPIVVAADVSVEALWRLGWVQAGLARPWAGG